jgi:23S rRNA (cytidine1920-2'-O)/16S rRNA (cytidine1409-2'-O)-methyltransferase
MGKLPSSAKSRADRYFLEHGHAASRAQARAAIEAGKVRADGTVIAKPTQLVAEGAQIEFARAHPYVSRGALKLAAVLDRFRLSPRNCVCLDLGASIGGFTQVLLDRGAARIYAVDVGHGQMDAMLRSDRRVRSLEGVNARYLTRTEIAEDVDAIVADVSSISLKLVLPAALRFARPTAWLVALVKPQFEAGRAGIDRGGIVRDTGLREKAVADIVRWLTRHGWPVDGTMESPIAGGSGNREYLVAAQRA